MELFEAISKRHSYRMDYTDDPVKEADLKKIVEAGLLAPSGRNCQTTEFIIINDETVLEKIRAMHPGNKAFSQAKAYIGCILDKDPEKVYKGLSFEVEDAAAAVENMLLAITSLGYASVWIDGWLRSDNNAEKIAEIINLPSNKILRIILPVGVAKVKGKQPPKKSFEERTCFNSYSL